MSRIKLQYENDFQKMCSIPNMPGCSALNCTLLTFYLGLNFIKNFTV